MADPTTVTVKVKDNDNKTASFSFYLGSSIDTLASIEAAAEALVADMAALMTGDVVEVSFSKAFDTSGWTLTPAAGQAQNRMVGGRFVHTSLSSPNARKELNLPTFDIETYVSQPGKDINTAHADVVALLASIQGTTYTNITDVELDTLAKAVETYGGKEPS